MQNKLKNVIEALLFAAEAPMTVEQLANVVEVYSQPQIEAAIDELKLEYEFLGLAFTLKEVAGGWCFRTRPELAGWLRKLRREQITRLSPAALETLAVVAYKQPVLKAEVDRMRGVDAGGVLRALMEKGLVRVLGRQDLPGQPLIYGTTKRFLEVFDLKDLSDLPTLKEMEALVSELERIDEAKEGPQQELNLGEAGEAAFYDPEEILLDRPESPEQDQDRDEPPEEAPEPAAAGQNREEEEEREEDIVAEIAAAEARLKASMEKAANALARPNPMDEDPPEPPAREAPEPPEEDGPTNAAAPPPTGPDAPPPDGEPKPE